MPAGCSRLKSSTRLRMVVVNVESGQVMEETVVVMGVFVVLPTIYRPGPTKLRNERHDIMIINP